jgi:transcriptional regulator with XRE-family HTH domain
MKLADKIIKLRKQFGWSQEELAEKLNVSRQSISKWEGALSIPDLTRIIKMGEIFGVSTDYLLKDEIEEIGFTSDDPNEKMTLITLGEANDYVKNAYEKSKAVVRALFFCFTSVFPLFILMALQEGAVLEISDSLVFGIGLSAIFILSSIGLAKLIQLNHKYKINDVVENMFFDLEYGADSVIKEKLEAYGNTYSRNTSFSIILMMLSALPLVLAGIFNASTMVLLFMLILLILLVYLSLYILIPASSVNESYRKLLHEGQYAYDKIEENKRITRFSAFYWPMVVAIYLGWSLWTMAWGITWIVWPIAGLLFAALIGLMNFLKLK